MAAAKPADTGKQLAAVGRALRILADPATATDQGKRDELAQLVDQIDPAETSADTTSEES